MEFFRNKLSGSDINLIAAAAPNLNQAPKTRWRFLIEQRHHCTSAQPLFPAAQATYGIRRLDFLSLVRNNLSSQLLEISHRISRSRK